MKREHRPPIRIAFLSPERGIGGGNRKPFIFYRNCKGPLIKAVYITRGKGAGIHRKNDGAQTVADEKLAEFIKKNHIQFMYRGRKLGEQLEQQLREQVTFVNNTNFVPSMIDERDVNIVISKTLHHHISTVYGSKTASAMDIVYNPIEVSRWRSLAKGQTIKHAAVTGKRLVIGRMARAEPSKWDYLVLATLQELDRRKEYGYGFVFVGMPYLYRRHLKRTLSKSMLSCIVFLPEIPDDEGKARFYRTIDVFWQTSRCGETFGNGIAEAFSFAKPVLTDSKDFIGKGRQGRGIDNAQIELVDHQANGLYCTHPATVIAGLAVMERRGKVFGRAGLRKVQSLYDAKNAVQSLTRILYNRLRSKGMVERDPRYERLRAIPSEEEMKNYPVEYHRRRAVVARANSIPQREREAYARIERRWHHQETAYLLVRKLGRVLGFDMERWS